MYKDYILGKKAVLFDLDGTIVDNLWCWEDAVRNVAARIEDGYAIDSDQVYKGTSLSDIWKNYLSENNLKLDKKIDELVKETNDEYVKLLTEADLEPRYGFWSLLEELKAKKFLVGLVSNSKKDIVDASLKKLDINNELFNIIVTGDQVAHRKPAPDIFIKASRELKVKPKEILVFEDSVNGAKSAEKSGMDIIVIWDGRFSEYEYPEKVLTFLDDFHSLPGNLDQTFMEYFKEEAQKAAPPGSSIS